MTSIGTKRSGFEANPAARFVNFRRGLGCTRLHGQSYHRCIAGNEHGGIEYYLYDRQYRRARASMPDAIPAHQIDSIRRMLLRENSLVRSVRCMADVDAPDSTLVLRHDVNTNELASFTLEDHGDAYVQTRDIVFHRNSDTEPTFVNVGCAMYDSLQFPLLHPFGGTTWYPGCKVGRHKITLAEYTKYLHLQDPGDRLKRMGRLTEEILLDNNSRILEERLQFIRYNQQFRKRVASMAAVRNPQNAAQRVGTVYLPTCTPGSPKYQKQLVEKALTVVQRLGHPTYFITFTCNAKWPEITENLLPGQVPSDRPILVARVFKLKLASLLKRIQQWDGGCAYYFCTVEFQHRGLPHAHIALRVKTPPRFTDDMKHIQTNMPEAKDDRYRQLVGTHMIHGCRRKFADERSGVKEVFECLRHKKKKDVVLRKCKRGYPKPYVANAYTSDAGYPVYSRLPPSDVDVHLDELDDPVAARTRREIEEAFPDFTFDEICRRVVPHSRELLGLFECHVNVEWAHSVQIIDYLYKYIYKNDSTAWIGILKEGDQVQRFMNAQRVSSSEAAWRILRFEINMSSHAVDIVHIHTPGENWIIYNEAEEIADEQTYREQVARMTISKLERYLNRPNGRLFDNLTLVEYFEKYRVCKWDQVPAYARNTSRLDNHPTRRMYVYQLRGREHFVYIPRKHPRQGEVFYLRILLCNLAARSWEQLRTDATGAVHRTYEQAARARGLLDGLDEYEFLFEDYAASAAIGIVNSEKLQQLFVMCLTHGEFQANDMWAKHKHLLCHSARGRLSNANGSRYSSDMLTQMAENEVLMSMAEHLDAMGTSLSQHGLPEPSTLCTDVLSRYFCEHAPSLYIDRTAIAREPIRTWEATGWSRGTGMTSEQAPVYHQVLDAVRSQTPFCKVIEARAGRGKTWLVNLIVATARSEGIVTLCVASTALAAQNYPGGRTAHSQLGIPAAKRQKGKRVECNLELGSQHAKFLSNVQLIIWDEIYSSNRFDIEAVDRMLRDLMDSSSPFGGKVMVFAGDRRQIPPVIPGAEPREVVCSVICASPSVWPACDVTELVHPVRDAEDLSYSAFVDSLGDNLAPAVNSLEAALESTDDCDTRLCHMPSMMSPEGRLLMHTCDLDKGIDFVYPDTRRLLTHAVEFARHAIITTTNFEVDNFTRTLIARMGLVLGDGIVHEFLSCDSVLDDPNNRSLSDEYLDGLPRQNGVPPHRLVLFEGAMCMLMRNLDPRRGLVNNTKCIIKTIWGGGATRSGRSTHKAVEVALVEPDPYNCGCFRESTETFVIPRISFNFEPPRAKSVTIVRRQFPLALCYAITAHKSQGQTLSRILIDQRGDSFAHGQSYVTFGRACNRDSVCVLVRSERLHVVEGESCALIRNVTYPGLLS